MRLQKRQEEALVSSAVPFAHTTPYRKLRCLHPVALQELVELRQRGLKLQLKAALLAKRQIQHAQSYNTRTAATTHALHTSLCRATTHALPSLLSIWSTRSLQLKEQTIPVQELLLRFGQRFTYGLDSNRVTI